ncbi:O-antigen ligase family protein [Pseudonocardia humida]|uniref:O-antigen ligase family protein n=1 Tax=Pseudonocardia humida TaxID=2800819 RepID=A0ABT1A4Z4_9PSEU|nr:O-antigen ligase family protein [Pseudonocardia humida]MCO1658076.1 O-antigen ligase family protein [Pseudonocardia humida]
MSSPGPGPLTTGGITVSIALPPLPFSGAPAIERRRVELGGGTLLVALGSLVLLALFVGTSTATLVVAAILAVALVIAAVLVPAVALALLVVGEFANVSGVLVAHGLPGVFTPLLGVGLLSALVATRSAENRARLASVPRAPAVLLAVYIAAVMPAVLISSDAAATAEKVQELWVDGLFLVLVLVLARLVERPWAVAAMIVLPLVAIAAMTVLNQLFLQETEGFWGFARISKALGEMTTTPRYAGPMEDSNFWGRVLILGLPMALALAHRAVAAKRGLPATGWVVSIALLLGAVYLTQSRGTLITAAVATIVWVIASGPTVRKRALLTLPVLAFVLLLPGIGDRLVNVSEAFEDAPAYSKDPSIVERGVAGQIAGQIWREHPLLGTGLATFASELDDYAARRPDLLIGVTTATHNLYLEILSETGVVGLAGWIVLIGGCLLLSVRSIVRLAGAPRDGPDGAPTRALAAATLAAVVAWSLASLFLHLSLVRTLWVVLALTGLLYTLTREKYAPSGSALVAARTATRGLRTGLGVSAVLVVAGAAVGGAILYNLSELTYTARATQTLVPAAGTYYSYGLDIRSRRPVMPAYAAMIQGEQSRSVLKVDAEPATGLVAFVGTGGSEQEAKARVDAAIAAAPSALRQYGADRQYDMVEVSPAEVEVERVFPRQALLLAGGAVVLELLFCLAVLRLARRQTR